MPGMAVSPARAAAFEVLLRVERESSYASELLHSPAYERLSRRDHALATELVLGVLRWRSRLDEELAGAFSQRFDKLDPEIMVALRVGLYQLRCLSRIPRRAALYESVELVKSARKRSAAPFVNAVLRKLADKPGHYDVALAEDNASSQSIARDLAHPPWLVERWAKEYGLLAAQKICQYDQSIPPNAIRLRSESVAEELEREGIELRPAQMLSSARIVASGDVTKTRAFRDREIVMQDQASQLVAALAGSADRDGASRAMRILDCCAAPGGKTLAMADHNPGAEIIAADLYPHRARLMRSLLHKVAQDKIRFIVADAQRLPVNAKFDRVLADVPCSGTGTLARNPEIKWRLQLSDLDDLHRRQVAILKSATCRLRPGGRIVYSTCSLEREENEDVVEEVFAENNSFRIVDCRRELEGFKESGDLIWPDIASLVRGPYLRTIPGVHPCDGFFAAILEKL